MLAWTRALTLRRPLYTTALKTIDALFKNGLMRGARLGYILGTWFFLDSGLKYKLYINGAKSAVRYIYNGIWPRVLGDLPMLMAARVENKDNEQKEDGYRKLIKTW
jgi:hypothetical protein